MVTPEFLASCLIERSRLLAEAKRWDVLAEVVNPGSPRVDRIRAAAWAALGRADEVIDRLTDYSAVDRALAAHYAQD